MHKTEYWHEQDEICCATKGERRDATASEVKQTQQGSACRAREDQRSNARLMKEETERGERANCSQREGCRGDARAFDRFPAIDSAAIEPGESSEKDGKKQKRPKRAGGYVNSRENRERATCREQHSDDEFL